MRRSDDQNLNKSAATDERDEEKGLMQNTQQDGMKKVSTIDLIRDDESVDEVNDTRP